MMMLMNFNQILGDGNDFRDDGVFGNVMDMMQQVLGGWDGEGLLESVEGLSEKVEGLSENGKGWTNQPAYVLTQPRYRFQD